MTYIIDLQKLWADRASIKPSQLEIAPGAYLDPRNMVISAIVIAHQDESKLLQALSALCREVLIREVVIVNCEKSAKLESALTQFARQNPKCYVANGRVGMRKGDAYNLGARYASGQYLLFLDPCVILPENSVIKLLATGFRKPHPWMVGTKACQHRLLLGKSQQAEILPEVSLLGGGFHVAGLTPDCIFMPAKDFMEMKGWDGRCTDNTFHLDLCLRIHQAGGSIYQAKDIQPIIFPKPPRPLRHKLQDEWSAWLGKYRFRLKYGRKHNFLSKLFVSKKTKEDAI